MNRVVFFIDGFNVYHSVKQASHDQGLKGRGTRWLDIPAFCSSFLPLISRDASKHAIHYFTAYASHLVASNPGLTARHQSYIRCLESANVQIVISKFKEKKSRCPHCGQEILRHEEKETDVAFAVRLMEAGFFDELDTAVLVSGDTDLAPAVRAFQKAFPQKRICFTFPYGRKNKELAQIVGEGNSFNIRSQRYTKYQFENPCILPNGMIIPKPDGW